MGAGRLHTQVSRERHPGLLGRTYGIDVLKCPRCEDVRMRIVSFITKTETIRNILEAVELPPEPPRAAPARPPPQGALEFP
ncbi:MAG: ATP-dependent helicase HrpA [Gemmatimonadetes bacterium]|nr:ATP-dependent helicase HrpA [Gemmatimonadota bacterium]